MEGGAEVRSRSTEPQKDAEALWDPDLAAPRPETTEYSAGIRRV